MKLAIVGGGNTWADAPFNDSSFDIWTTASVAKVLPRVSVIFEFHDSDAMQDVSVYERAKKVYYKKDFPIEEMAFAYGEVFNSSMTMMLAYANEFEYDEIILYGVDNALDEEYAKYRANFLYVLGYIRGMGRRVIISDGSMLMPSSKRYGYEKDYKQIRFDAMKKDLDRMKLNCEYLRGAVDAASTFMKL